MDRKGKKTAHDTTGKAPWREPLHVRPEIMAAFLKWKTDPDSVYEQDRKRAEQLKKSQKPTRQGHVPDFVIPGFTGNSFASPVSPVAKRYTNADPLSAAALELTHIQSKTRYGFDTLSMQPHTRRRESLFHNKSATMTNFGKLGQDRMKLEKPSLQKESDDQTDDEANSGIGHQREIKTLMITPVANFIQTPVSAQLRPLDVARAITKEASPEPRMQRRFLSLQEWPFKDSKSNANSLAHEQSRRDTMDSVSTSCNDIYMLSSETIELPLIHMSIAFMPDSQHVAVKSMRCSNVVDPETKLLADLQIFLRLHMKSRDKTSSMLTKTTTVQTGTKEPKFEDLLYFSFPNTAFLGLSMDIQVCAKVDSDEYRLLGRANISMSGMDSDTENVVCEVIQIINIDNTLDNVCLPLNALCIKLCFEARIEQLELTIVRGSGVGQCGTQALDTYVKIRIVQPSKTANKARTLIQKRSKDPFFNETFNFVISPKVDDLNFTSVLITLMRRRRIATDCVIGQVCFGNASSEESELEHWHKVLQNPGVGYKRWHKLVSENETNDR